MHPALLFRTSPLTGIALCVCLATIFCCIRLIRRHRLGPDRFLTALIGLISTYQGLRLLKEADILSIPAIRSMSDFVDLPICGLCLMALLVVRISRSVCA